MLLIVLKLCYETVCFNINICVTASSAGPGETANDQSYNELMSRFLKLKGSDER